MIMKWNPLKPTLGFKPGTGLLRGSSARMSMLKFQNRIRTEPEQNRTADLEVLLRRSGFWRSNKKSHFMIRRSNKIFPVKWSQIKSSL